MKHTQIVAVLLLVISLTSCVQKSYKRIIVATVTIPNKADIKTVGIRGSGNPLSWDNDYPMKAIIKDSILPAL